MSKLAPTSIKYVIKASIKANGVVEKPDIIGAVFGQTEGLLGSELDLRELQRTGRIGRIDVKIKSSKGKSDGEIIIPSSLDASETSLIAATLETIERVGPCTARIKLIGVEDTRSDKRKFVVDKAKEILKNLSDRGVPDSSEISEQIKEAVRTEEVREVFGLPAGPNVMDSEDIIIVEGRADVINLLRFGVRNTIAIEGTSASRGIIDIAKRKTATLFVDGDRGGQLIAKELMQASELDYIAVAPEGKEVEELTQKEAYKALRDKVPADQFFAKSPRETAKAEPAKAVEARPEEATEKPDERPRYSRPSGYSRSPDRGRPRDFGRRDRRDDRSGGFRRDSGRPGMGRRDDRRGGFGRRDDRPSGPRYSLDDKERELFKKTLNELVGTRAACIFNDKDELLGKVPVSELENTLRTIEGPNAVVFDGIVSLRLGEVARRKGIKFLIGMEKEKFMTPVAVLCREDL
jgi:DNA primase